MENCAIHLIVIIYSIIISMLKILIFFFIFFITKISEKYNFIYNIFPDIKKGGDESYKTVLLVTMNTLLITSYTVAFSFINENVNYSKFYYVFLILITTLTKWQYEKLYFKIFLYQEKNNISQFEKDEFIKKKLCLRKIKQKSNLLC